MTGAAAVVTAPPPAAPSRRVPWLLVPLVLALHLWLADALAPHRLGPGGADAPPVKIQVAFVRELAPAEPPAAPPPVVRRLRRSLPPAPAASAPGEAGGATAPPVLTPVEPLPPLPTSEALPELAALAEPAPSPLAAVVAPASSAATAAASPASFEWPPSTRLSYRLSGNYRGPVEGQARVEWRVVGSRYQVHLEVGIGPPFAPLVSRRLSSDGEVSDEGLRPRRYDEETQAVLREPRRLTIHLDEGEVRLPGGGVLARPPGVQDSASQFVQMTWMFTTQPDLLRAGQSIELPLALPRRVDRWTYDVLEREMLSTPLGEIEGVHVRPRRLVRPTPDLTAEFWVAPTLQNLPVRIVIRQDVETYVDLMLERLPQQAER